MALNWEWKDKCGELVIEQTIKGETNEYTLSLYQGNAFLIILFEDLEKNTYSMYNFLLDKDHAKNCLGLNPRKGYDRNIFNDGFDTFKTLRIDKAKHTQYKDLVSMFAQGFDNLTIEIYNSAKKEG